MESSIILEHLLIASATFAALCIPAVSIAFLIVKDTSGEDQRRVSAVITYGMFAGLVFISCTLLSLIFLIFDAVALYWIVGFIFIIGCLSIAIIFLILGGYWVWIERKIPLLQSEPTQEKSKTTQE